MKERLKYLRDMLSFRTMWENQEEEDWEDYDQKDNYISGEEYADDTKELAGIGSGIVYLAIIVMILIAFAAYFIMSRYHLYTGYSVTASYEAEDISGTRYEKLGNGFIKYGSDGVTFVNGKNETQWSSAYTIETPQVDICGETMLIYEQQGYLVEVIDTEGTVGSFQTDLPILKGVIAKNGVAALMLKDDQDVRIRLLSTDGTALAEVRTTLEDQGQPLDLAISSDAQNLMVSLARIGAGSVDGTIAFYDFSSHFTTLVHFNGTNFDIPFLEQKCAMHKLPYHFSHLQGIDLYRRVAPYKLFLKTPNFKQKTVEYFLGIGREDTYSGGELINVYHQYVEDPNTADLELLLLHNADDIKGLIEILPILSYYDLFNKPLKAKKVQANTYTDYFGTIHRELLIRCSLPTSALCWNAPCCA